ncbi:MAG: hypothetical protein IPM57_08010 [Oligoflexia bacterium]|nr:hypothetical protein [Oligoflexia bacterium]
MIKFIALTFFIVNNAYAVDLGYECLTRFQNILSSQQERPLVKTVPSSGWRLPTETSSYKPNEELISKITKEVRNAFLAQKIKDLEKQNAATPPAVEENHLTQGKLIDAGLEAIKNDFDINSQLKFFSRYNAFKSQKQVSERKIQEDAAALVSLNKQLENAYLKPTIIFAEKPLTPEAEILSVLAGNAVIIVGQGHDKTVESFRKNIAIQKRLSAEFDHLADSSLAGVNKMTDLPDHIRIALKKSHDLAEELLLKSNLLNAQHPQLHDAIVIALHHHVVAQGKLVTKLFDWSFKDKQIFPQDYLYYRYVITNKSSASKISLEDFRIARIWLTQELEKPSH